MEAPFSEAGVVGGLGPSGSSPLHMPHQGCLLLQLLPAYQCHRAVQTQQGQSQINGKVGTQRVIAKIHRNWQCDPQDMQDVVTPIPIVPSSMTGVKIQI